MASNLASLRAVPLFAGVPDEQLELVARVAVKRKFPKHRTVVFAGDKTSALYVIVSGSAKVLSRDSEGREVILAFLSQGECFGEMGLIDGEPRSADVVVVDPSELLEISRDDLVKAFKQSSDLSLNIMKSLVTRLRQANWKIEGLALMDVYGRVAKNLFDLSEVVGGVRIIRHKVTKQDMAKLVGASREMVTRVMKDLERSGYIRINDGNIVITMD
ncbi:Crp/Fnr family transcriptional regulator [Propionivibrio dicarboxylicus]|uniref:CRP/FNR family transcriptional regulator, cyclic AMP receptor protein n=1 Tax=Propionivibrio dicarboxylicus TaxID=83767 RepID=A0A1G8BU60_9RHOO|nr:Crp/Fnr family transcriptional regulator [Propionivibrio dicarboxylicus]SDH36737.1 CRP/FNR family transcriptional regulator, cyclic AMP receptor protein [Propionivibrio dicarboxylicus]